MKMTACKKICKRNFLIICFMFFSFSAFCQNVNFFTKGKPEMSLSSGLSLWLKNDLHAGPFAFDSSFSADCKELYFDCGTLFQPHTFDFTGNVFYMPTFFGNFRAGLGFGYHYSRYYNEFSENDFLPSLRFCWCKTSFFNVNFALGLLLKNSMIDEVNDYQLNIFTNSFFLGLRFDWNITPVFNVWCSIASVDYYDYPLLGTPFFKFGAGYKFRDNVSLDSTLSFKYVDMITSAVYLNECIYKTAIKVYF